MELDPEARRILSLVREARTPGADDKARVEQGLAVALGASAAAAGSMASPAAATSASGLTTKVAGSAAALKWTLGGCALIAAAVAAYGSLPDRAPSQPPRAAAVATPSALPAVVPSRAIEQAPEPASATPSIDAPEPAVDGVRARARAAQSHARHERGALGDELELLHAAQSAWRSGDAARALALVSEHRARHPRSALGLEREALRVLALCDLGRTEEAVRLGHAWLARAPGSPLRASIERSCAMK